MKKGADFERGVFFYHLQNNNGRFECHILQHVNGAKNGEVRFVRNLGTADDLIRLLKEKNTQEVVINDIY